MLLDTKHMNANKKELICLGIVIKKLRNSKELSQEKLGFLSGLDRTYISGLERGIRNPSFLILLRIITALGSTTQSFFDIYTEVFSSEHSEKAVDGI
jgi:transcriptional regulator with XRE-family HTH domain